MLVTTVERLDLISVERLRVETVIAAYKSEHNKDAGFEDVISIFNVFPSSLFENTAELDLKPKRKQNELDSEHRINITVLTLRRPGSGWGTRLH
jgi:hypothetical protein